MDAPLRLNCRCSDAPERNLCTATAHAHPVRAGFTLAGAKLHCLNERHTRYVAVLVHGDIKQMMR